jgi:integrase
MHAKLTQNFVDTAAAKPGADRTIYWDETQRGFGLMVTSKGHKSYVIQYRAGGHTSRRMTIDGVATAAEARKAAKGKLGDVAARDADPLDERRRAKEKVKAEARKKREAGKNALRSIAEEYLKREGKKLRSKDERKDVLERLVYPKLGGHQIDEIKRSDIIRLLDKIEDEQGPVMADKVLAFLRKLMNWHAVRDDHFRSPIVPGMARTKPKERARKRTLDDDEMRAIWQTAERRKDTFAYLVRFILLTGSRRNEAARMARSEMEPRRNADGRISNKDVDWIIPARRYKTKRDHVVPLSSMAKELVDELPRIVGCDYMFTTDGVRAIAGFSKAKRDFDQAVLEDLRRQDPAAKPLANWRLHDLRRTARTLMSRTGVDADHAERCIGHVIGGQRETYDRYEFRDEKAHAFEGVATLIDRILKPQKNVLPIKQQA